MWCSTYLLNCDSYLMFHIFCLVVTCLLCIYGSEINTNVKLHYWCLLRFDLRQIRGFDLKLSQRGCSESPLFIIIISGIQILSKSSYSHLFKSPVHHHNLLLGKLCSLHQLLKIYQSPLFVLLIPSSYSCKYVCSYLCTSHRNNNIKGFWN